MGSGKEAASSPSPPPAGRPWPCASPTPQSAREGSSIPETIIEPIFPGRAEVCPSLSTLCSALSPLDGPHPAKGQVARPQHLPTSVTFAVPNQITPRTEVPGLL